MVLGRVSGLFGVRGWVRIFSHTEPREAILDYRRWYLQKGGDWQEKKVAEGQRHGKSVIARLENVDDRDAAAVLIGSNIAVPRSDLPEPGDGTYYWADLVGLRVVNCDGAELGKVAYVMETGANDVLVTGGDRERLIPFVADKVILGVDFDKGVINVDWEWD